MSAAAARAEADPALEPPGLARVTGMVKDSEGNPVAEASVRLTSRTGSFDRTAAEGLSSDSGEFDLRKIEPGHYLLQIRKDGFSPLADTLLLQESEHLELDRVLRRAGALFGRVRATKGSVVEGTRLLVRDLLGNVLLEAPLNEESTGDYELTGIAPGEYRITAVAPGYAPRTESGILLEAHRATRVDLRLGRGGILRIRTRAADGQPLTEQLVLVQRLSEGLPLWPPQSGPAVEAPIYKTDTEGSAELRLLEPGRYLVCNLIEVLAREEVLVREGKITEVQLQSPS